MKRIFSKIADPTATFNLRYSWPTLIRRVWSCTSNRELKALFTVGAASAVLPGGISNRELKVVPQAA
jgi:hypothetical protein